MQKHRRWSPEDLNKFQELYAAGATIEYMAERFDVSSRAIKGLVERLRARGIDLPPRKTLRPVTVRETNTVKRLQKAGLTHAEMAAEMGVDRMRVRTITEKLREMARRADENTAWKSITLWKPQGDKWPRHRFEDHPRADDPTWFWSSLRGPRIYGCPRRDSARGMGQSSASLCVS